MSEKSKAKKLADAKKRLKEYKLKNEDYVVVPEVKSLETPPQPKATLQFDQINSDVEVSAVQQNHDQNGLEIDVPNIDSATVNVKQQQNPLANTKSMGSDNQLRTIELLIQEKETLSRLLERSEAGRNELLVQIDQFSQMLNDKTRKSTELEKNLSELSVCNAKLAEEYKLVQSQAQQKIGEVEKCMLQIQEQNECYQEIKTELELVRNRNKELETEINSNEKKKIESSRTIENSHSNGEVEKLTQAKFMHEQMISDLQSMVKKLENEQEQATNQYQNYIQHLNKEITTLSEKNLEQTDKLMKLTLREESLVKHIGDLEREIQNNLTKHQHNVENSSTVVELNEKLKQLEEQIKTLTAGTTKLETEISLTKKDLGNLEKLNQDKSLRIGELEETLQTMISERPDDSKLLAAMESDKVAASRAVTQNEELKLLVEEIKEKLIQVTNDKAELINALHAEQHSNRELKANHADLETRVKEIEEKLHFKDEEMIRLSHENNELTSKLDSIDKKGDQAPSVINLDNLENEMVDSDSHSHHDDHNHHEHEHENHHNGDHSCESHGDHSHDSCAHSNKEAETKHKDEHFDSRQDEEIRIASSEAMVKLQERFKSVMSEVANLTDEKQRLEHLVLQLQGETETIGEYIALYQTQRRILKQREIEKETQLLKLSAERKEIHEKLIRLNQLIGHTTNQPSIQHVMLPNTEKIGDKLYVDSSKNETNNNMQLAGQHITPINSEITNDVVTRINDLINELNINEPLENIPKFTTSVDHCLCCSGKFETI